jgi:hypothetical protein
VVIRVVFTCESCMCQVMALDIVALETAEGITGVFGTCSICDRVIARTLPKNIVQCLRDEGLSSLPEQAHKFLETLEV